MLWISFLWRLRKLEKLADNAITPEFCDERHGNLEQMVQEHKKDATKRHQEFKDDMKEEFREVKRLIINGGKP